MCKEIGRGYPLGMLLLASATPVGYVVTVALFAGVVALALAPPRRPRLVAKAGFLIGTVVNEMPFLYLVALLAASALAFGQGDIDSPTAWTAVGLAGLTSVGLLVLIRRALATEAAVAQALEDGLGGTRRARREIELASRAGGQRSLARAVVAPWLVHRGDVWRLRDIAYGEAGRRNLLDV